MYITQLNTFYCLVLFRNSDVYILCITALNWLIQSSDNHLILEKQCPCPFYYFLFCFVFYHKQYWKEYFCARFLVYVCWIFHSLTEWKWYYFAVLICIVLKINNIEMCIYVFALIWISFHIKCLLLLCIFVVFLLICRSH